MTIPPSQQPLVMLLNFPGIWEPHGQFPNPIKVHLQKQDLHRNAKPPVKKFGSCSSVTFRTQRAIRTGGSLIPGISFKLCKGILATSSDRHSPGKYIFIGSWLPKQLLCQALEPQARFSLSTAHSPLASTKSCPGRPSSAAAVTGQPRITWEQLTRN